MSNPIPSRFFDLAIITIAGRASNEELSELGQILADNPRYKEEYKKLKLESDFLKETVLLDAAGQATEGEFPEWARADMQQEVNEVFSKSDIQPEYGSLASEKGFIGAVVSWPKLLGSLGAACALVALIFYSNPRPSDDHTRGAAKQDDPIIEIALLDVDARISGSGVSNIATGSNKTNTDNSIENSRSLMEEQWPGVEVKSFSDKLQFTDQWLESWPESNKPKFKIYYLRQSRELKVLGKIGEERIEETFVVEGSMQEALIKAKAFAKQKGSAASK